MMRGFVERWFGGGTKLEEVGDGGKAFRPLLSWTLPSLGFSLSPFVSWLPLGEQLCSIKPFPPMFSLAQLHSNGARQSWTEIYES